MLGKTVDYTIVQNGAIRQAIVLEEYEFENVLGFEFLEESADESKRVKLYDPKLNRVIRAKRNNVSLSETHLGISLAEAQLKALQYENREMPSEPVHP